MGSIMSADLDNVKIFSARDQFSNDTGSNKLIGNPDV